MTTEPYHQPAQLVTPDELNANWPMGTVVQEVHTGTCCPDEPFCDFYEQLWVMAFMCGWTRVGDLYDDEDCTPRLPVRLLFNPEWDVVA